MIENDLANDEGLLRARLRKFLLIRLLLTILLLLLIVAAQGRRGEYLHWAGLHPLYFAFCIIFFFTFLCAWSLERTRHLTRFAWIQILFDVAAVTVLVFLSGGIESSFSFLYFLVIIGSALLLYRRGSILTASLCGFVYGLLLDLQYFEWIFPSSIIEGSTYPRDSGVYFLRILMNIAGFYLVGLLAGYLGEELHKSSRRVREHEMDLRKLSTLHQSIVHSMTSGLLTIDLNNCITFYNHAAHEILGLTGEALNSRPLAEIFPGLELHPTKLWMKKKARAPAGWKLHTGTRRARK
jgi:two-component system, NtrC family, sensor histidine kinase PilS